ncbi:uncharacterized protein LOC135717250 [Ochlerotatus camptorhynchus]|uniref:uncharacterized protein LOC135717250 n=1 Tax=Ochlerotatus camptorhynchus TaxID=644619 RepID=UPI0031D911DA
MDGISFDSLTYLSDDSFVIECNDDFGGICEDIVRLASASHFVDHLNPLDIVPGNDSPPSNTYYSSVRCFDKEMPSLFSDMEYLTEVSPETEMAIVPTRNVPLAVNPSEFSWTRKETKPEEKTDATTRLMEQPTATEEANATETSPANNRYLSSTNYRKILQNYIQKGKRKLEASSYSKMKATVVSVKAGTTSTSLIETVTCASYGNLQSSTATGSRSVREPDVRLLPEPAPLPNYRCLDCNSCFLSVERLKKHTCIITEQYQCQLCRREFRKRKTLEQHIKSHDKVFSTDEDLRKW